MNSLILFFALAGGEELFHTKPKPKPTPERAEQRQEAVKPLISHEATSPKSRPFRLEITYPTAVAEPLPEPVKPKSVQWLYFTMASCKPCKPIERDLFPWLRASKWNVSGDADSHVRIHDWKGDGDAFQMWNVQLTPTFILVVDGKEVKRYTGDNYPGREAIANEFNRAGNSSDVPHQQLATARSVNIGTIHGAARLREGLAYAARYMGAERGTLVWTRTGERVFRVGKEHDWKDVVGTSGRLSIKQPSIPETGVGLSYRRTDLGYLTDPDPLLVPFPTSDAPTAAGSSAVGSSILIISTVLRLAWEVWALTHPSVDIVLPDETKIAAVMQDGKLCIDIESGPAIQLKWSLFFGLWAPKADVPIKAVEVSADAIVLQMGSRWVSELRLKVVD